MEIGRRFGLLVVVGIGKQKGRCKKISLCKCDCGNLIEVRDNNLLSGSTKSCKCLRDEPVAYKKRAIERFLSYVEKTETCWNWIGPKQRSGFPYGNFSYHSRYLLAHRVSWMLFIGEITTKCVLHKCDNPSCVNPDHLFLGSHRDNNLDCFKKGRKSTKRENHPLYKVTKEIVKEIFDLRKTGMSQIKIGGIVGLNQTRVSYILRGKHWLSC